MTVAASLTHAPPEWVELDPLLVERIEAIPDPYRRTYERMLKDYAPITGAEVEIVLDILQFRIQIADLEKSRQALIASAQSRLEDEARMLAEKPRFGFTPEERMLGLRFKRAFENRKLHEKAREAKFNVQEGEAKNAQHFAVAIAELGALRQRLSPQLSAQFQREETHCRREIRKLTADLAKSRKDRQEYHYAKDQRTVDEKKRALAREAEKQQAAELERAQQFESQPQGGPTTSGADVLAATTIAVAHAIVARAAAEAEAAEQRQSAAQFPRGAMSASLQSAPVTCPEPRELTLPAIGEPLQRSP